MNDPSRALSAVRSILKDLSKSLRRERWGEAWFSQIDGFLDIARSEDLTCSDYYDLGASISSIFGGMDSFNDTNYSAHAEDLKSQLYEANRDLLRSAWRALGRTTHKVPDKEILHVGDHVKLIAGETISMRPSGETRAAPISKLLYRVRDVYPPDIDGMPVYFIQADSHCWVARHNALKKT